MQWEEFSVTMNIEAVREITVRCDEHHTRQAHIAAVQLLPLRHAWRMGTSGKNELKPLSQPLWGCAPFGRVNSPSPHSPVER